MTTEEKFNAAVNVIKGLPKNGSYQPSHDLMLRFYAYYKQATLGPCKGSRPAFWDIVGRAKYDAWKNLGELPKSEAMARYVNELHQIVETMSFSDKVADFLNAPTTGMEKVKISDLELVAGDIIEKVKSRNNSPLESRDQSPQRMNGYAEESPYHSETDTDHSDGEYVDTIEAPEPAKKHIPNGTYIPLTNGYAKEHKKKQRTSSQSVDITQEISVAVQSLRADIEALKDKVNVLEARSIVIAKRKEEKVWWKELPPQALILMFVWPFLASFIVNKLLNRRKT